MYNLPEWPKVPPTWSAEALPIQKQGPLAQLPDLTLAELLRKSDEFPINFPIDSVRCKTLKDSVPTEVLERNINSAYPLIHERALFLYEKFLIHKRKYGSVDEKELYKDMTVLQLIERFLTKRAVMFMGRFDLYILLDGTQGSGNWERIGKDPKSQLTFDKCLSYDEVKLSALLSVSSYSYFINNGTRTNMGKMSEDRTDIQAEGIVIGIIGARLKKVGVMEYEEIVISKFQNTESNGYGPNSDKSLHSVFADFYEEPCFTFKQMLALKRSQPQRFPEIADSMFFDNVVYAKRIGLSIDTLLIEANHRAKLKNTTAYIHVVGIGLGVWKCSPHQEEVFVETFAKRLKVLGKDLSSVSDVYFSYFNQKSCGDSEHGDVMKIEGHPTGIKIYISKRDPHTKLTGPDADKLLVVSYAWDGNALPGNEFWDGKLGSTGDSAAAASTQIAELHNPHINLKVSAENLQVVTYSGIVPFYQYGK